MRGPSPVALRLKGASCPAQRDMGIYQRVDPLAPAGFLLLGHGGEMNAALQIPGLTNPSVQPIRNCIDMLSTGIKSLVSIKIAGPDLKESRSSASKSRRR
jgi:hypothetical protein